MIWTYAAFRYEYGGDYTNYEEIFVALKYGIPLGKELLFLALLYIFPKYYLFIIFTSTIFALSFYYLIRKYAEPEYYWLCMLIMFLQTSLIIYNFAAQRSALVVYIFIFAFHFIVKRKFIYYACLVVLSSLFHSSSLLLLPLYFITYLKLSARTREIIIVAAVVSLFAGGYLGSFFLSNVSILFGDNGLMDKYSVYLESASTANAIGLIALIPYVFFCWLFLKYLHKENFKTNKIIVCLSVAYIFIMLWQLDIVGRFSMYLWPFYMLGVLIILPKIKNNFYRRMVTILILLQSSLSLFSLYNAPYGLAFYEYKTIFEATYLP